VPRLTRHSRSKGRQNSWRNYQAELRKGNSPRKNSLRENTSRKGWRRILGRSLVFGLLLLAAISGAREFFSSSEEPGREVTTRSDKPISDLDGKEDIRQILDAKAFCNLTRKELALPAEGQVLKVETSLDEDLQNYLLERIDRQNSRQVGIVVMEASTGRILAMASYDRTDPAENPCLLSDFPAASVFKIVTAAAAVDQYGYAADTPMHFTGAKHTLYKRQLTDKVDRWTTTIPFREAFADSINPVFGKLGGLRLRKPLLERSAAAFGFNQPLDFDLPLPPSHFEVGDQPYNWAEAASGFNNDTTISPLHGAMIASAVLNGGNMVTPSLIDRIVAQNGEVIYRREAEEEMLKAMSPRAAAALTEMMETTVTSGTARKAFRRFRQDKILSDLQIGGKTGSIDNASHDVRFDWFVGFAKERRGDAEVVVAVMVGHEKFIGIRAGEYARMAMTRYFRNLEEKKVPMAGETSGTAKGKVPAAPSRPS